MQTQTPPCIDVVQPVVRCRMVCDSRLLSGSSDSSGIASSGVLPVRPEARASAQSVASSSTRSACGNTCRAPSAARCTLACDRMPDDAVSEGTMRNRTTRLPDRIASAQTRRA